MNAEDRKRWDSLDAKLDALTAAYQDQSAALQLLRRDLDGNGSGKGVYQRLEWIERWIERFWPRLLTALAVFGGLVGATFKGVDVLGKAAGWW